MCSPFFIPTHPSAFPSQKRRRMNEWSEAGQKITSKKENTRTTKQNGAEEVSYICVRAPEASVPMLGEACARVPALSSRPPFRFDVLPVNFLFCFAASSTSPSPSLTYSYFRAVACQTASSASGVCTALPFLARAHIVSPFSFPSPVLPVWPPVHVAGCCGTLS